MKRNMSIYVIITVFVFFLVSSATSQALTISTIGYQDISDPGITSARSDWGELAEVEDYVSDPRITAGGPLSIFSVLPTAPWNSGLWIYGSPGYVQTEFSDPSDSLFVQFESDTNDGWADFYIDGVLVYSLDTYNGGWFAVVFSDLTWAAHTLKVVATSTTYPRDLAIDVMGSGAPKPGPDPALEVEIDIKPCSYPNSINLKSKGVVPVAVLTTEDFDASTIDPETVEFAGAQPLRWTVEDVDYDGDLDLLFHFKTQELDLNEDSTEATLTGRTYEDDEITGTDDVRIVPPKK